MPRVTCRCGHTLSIPVEGPDRVVCPKCNAKMKVRRVDPTATPPPSGDGFIRFACPCGRRLKVKAEGSPESGVCPDCGRVVPVPSSSSASALPMSDPETRTEEMSATDVALLEQWARARLAAPGGSATGGGGNPASSAIVRAEAGLRVCPKCRRPVHLNATSCRHCGSNVPRR